MVKLLVIYFATLAVCTFVPAKVSSFTFINLSQSIQFEIDPNSPAMSVEKDFLSTTTIKKETKAFASLNDVVGKPWTPRRVVASTPVRPILDYSRTVRTDTFSQFMVSGPLELKQGLALTDEHRIEIHRENKGNIVEFGEVDIQKGTYTIGLSGLEGHICARLHGSRQDIIGQGCYSLDRIKGLKKSTQQGPLLSVSKSAELLASNDRTPSVEVPLAMKKIEEKVQPQANVEQLFREQVGRKVAQSKIINYYDYDNPNAKPLNPEINTATGNREDEGSTTVTSITIPGFPNTITVANAFTGSRGAVIPPRKAQQALVDFARDAGVIPPGAQQTGTIWGRTLSEGRSVAGVQVEVEGRDDVRPLYLNEFYIPDPNQRSTASHGLYTFVGVPEGEYSIRATRGTSFVGFQNVSVRENFLSLGDIDSTERRRTTRLAVYDLINKTSQSAVVTLQNYEEDVIVEDGQKDVNVQDNYDTAYALVNPLNKKYLTAQYILNPGEDLYNFPMVSSDWVESVLNQAKLERPVRSKIVLGIGSQKPFRVEAIGSKSAQIVYFDSQGQILEGNYGVAGGGFFILDPEDEVNEYAIQFAGEKSVRSVYMPTIPNVLNIIQL